MKRNNPNRSSVSSTSKKKKTNKYYCVNCNKYFYNFKTAQQFIIEHLKLTDDCAKQLFSCVECGQFFLKEQHRAKHFSSKKQCYATFKQSKISSNYLTSEVAIPKQLSNQIETNNKSVVNFRNKNKLSGFFTYLDYGMNKSFTTKTSSQLKSSLMLCQPIKESSNDILQKKGNISTSTTTHSSITDENHLQHNRTMNDCNTNDLQETQFYNSDDDIEICSIDNNSGHNSVVQSISNVNIEINTNDNESFSISNESVCNFETISVNDDEEIIDENVTIDFPTQDFIIESSYHLMELKETHKLELSMISKDDDYVDGLELLKILMTKKQSLTSYDDLMQWKHSFSRAGVDYYSFTKLRQAAIKRVYGVTLGSKLEPKVTLLTCPSGTRINVITYNIDACIYDMLSDDDLTSHDNLIFPNGNVDNPFKWQYSKFYKDFDQSGFYTETLKDIGGNQEDILLCPIALYMDETVLDSYGKLTLHPVVITLMIYNLKTRNLDMSWRTIGYMPSQASVLGKQTMSSKVKLTDFHFILKYILEGVEKIQAQDGLYWDFVFKKIPNKVYRRLLKFPLSHSCGDGKGNATLCGKYQIRHNTTYLCRDCDIKLMDSDNPNIKCNFRIMKKLHAKSQIEMAQQGFHKIDPYFAFSNIDMGSNIYGINGATPADPCHQINKGPVERLPAIFMDRLNTRMVSNLDIHVGFVCKNFAHQSARDYPNLRCFRNGILESKKLSSDENIGRVFAIYLVLITSDFEKLVVGQRGRKIKNVTVSMISQNEYNGWIQIFEETLILTSWVYHDSHPKAVFNGGRKSLVANRINNYILLYNKIAVRHKGMGNKLLKMHQLTHLWWIIRMYSCLSNIDTARCESHHKKKKAIAANTQRRVLLLDLQTAKQEYNYDLFIKAMKRSGICLPDLFEMKQDVFDCSESTIENNDHEEPINKRSIGSGFILDFDYDRSLLICTWTSRSLKGRCCKFNVNILKALFNKLQGYNHGIQTRRIKSIQGFTEYVDHDDNTITYRACPEYRSEYDWFDWAVFDWGDEEGRLEGQLLVLLNMETMIFETFSESIITGITIHNELLEPNVYTCKQMVLIHSVSNAGNNSRQPALQQRRLINNEEGPMCSLGRFCNMETNYQLVDVQTIAGPTFVIPDEVIIESPYVIPGNCKSIIVIKLKAHWYLSFLNYDSQELLESVENLVDDEIDINDITFPFEG